MKTHFLIPCLNKDSVCCMGKYGAHDAVLEIKLKKKEGVVHLMLYKRVSPPNPSFFHIVTYNSSVA